MAREEERRRDAARLETASLEGIDFRAIEQLSHEARERLDRARSPTLGAAGRVSGTPAAIDTLALVLARPGGDAEARSRISG